MENIVRANWWEPNELINILPNVRMRIQHGSHQRGSGSRHTSDKNQRHLAVVLVNAFVGADDVPRSRNHAVRRRRVGRQGDERVAYKVDYYDAKY